MIMIDGSVKRNHKFGFKLQSSHVIEKCYNMNYFVICCNHSVSGMGLVLTLSLPGVTSI